MQSGSGSAACLLAATPEGKFLCGGVKLYKPVLSRTDINNEDEARLKPDPEPDDFHGYRISMLQSLLSIVLKSYVRDVNAGKKDVNRNAAGYIAEADAKYLASRLKLGGTGDIASAVSSCVGLSGYVESFIHCDTSKGRFVLDGNTNPDMCLPVIVPCEQDPSRPWKIRLSSPFVTESGRRYMLQIIKEQDSWLAQKAKTERWRKRMERAARKRAATNQS